MNEFLLFLVIYLYLQGWILFLNTDLTRNETRLFKIFTLLWYWFACIGIGFFMLLEWLDDQTIFENIRKWLTEKGPSQQ